MSEAQLHLPIPFECDTPSQNAEPSQARPEARKGRQPVLKPPVGSPAPAPRIYLTCEQVCERYQVSRQTIWRWPKEVGFPAPHKFSSRAVRWALDEIEAFDERIGKARQNRGSK